MVTIALPEASYHSEKSSDNVILPVGDERDMGFCNPEYQLSSRVRFNSTKLFCNLTNLIACGIAKPIAIPVDDLFI